MKKVEKLFVNNGFNIDGKGLLKPQSLPDLILFLLPVASTSGLYVK